MEEAAQTTQAQAPARSSCSSGDIAPVALSQAVEQTPRESSCGNGSDMPGADSSIDAATYEEANVHAVYDAIAPHFSATRHKPWPFITEFLLSRPPGSVGLDVGCGNGKYLPVNPTVHLLGSDRSAALVRLARTERQGEVVVADGLSLPYREASADFVICIAVIHHLSTRERRQEAIAKLLTLLCPPATAGDGGGPERKQGDIYDGDDDGSAGGRGLVYVWALEQSSSRRGWDEGSAQDRMVPWAMKQKGKENPDRTYQRYYHLYRKGELEEDVVAAGGVVCQSGYEKDNWWVIFGHKGR